MYRVLADGNLIYTETIENIKIFQPKISLEVNKTGSFSFVIYPEHPYYPYLYKLKTIITVYQDDFLIFRGRILNDEIGFYNQKNIECEGELAFLLDSTYRPYSFSGSIRDFLESLIASHNSQVDAAHQFVLGRVTVTDSNNYITRSDIEYNTTYDVINKKLIEMLGGYISVRHEDGVSYIDYLTDFNLLSSQKVEFAKNLLDMKRIRKGEEIKTILIPLGAKLKDSEGNDTDVRLTIENVNNGLDYVQDDDAIAQYGRIVTTHIWEDVTEPQNLLNKAKAYLGTLTDASETLELSAADLASIDRSVESFRIGTYVRVTSNPHGIDQNFLVSSLTVDLLNPASNTLTLGGVVQTFTEQSTHIVDGLASGLKGEKGEKGDNGEDGKDAAIQSATAPTDTSYLWLDISVEPPSLKRYNPDTDEWEAITDTSAIVDSILVLEEAVYSEISKTKDEITSTVTENYYLKSETDALISSISTEITQTKDDITFMFNTFNQDLSDVANNTAAEFEDIRKYIRFVDGKILLGEVGNELELRIGSDKISFMQSNSEVAYFSDNKLFVTDGEYTNSLILGNFAFIPRTNGNLSFKKIV